MQDSDPSSSSPSGIPARGWLLLDALLVFLGAFLLFLIQPVYSKRILPWFGGAPLVWATALVFFQTALLAGYAYAHFIINKLPPKRQLFVHVGLLVASLSFLPVAPGVGWKPHAEGAPSWHILAMLICTLGLPYMLLASTSPLVQAWIARHRHQIVPYRLFGLSNLASLLGLLCYPFILEPSIGLETQFAWWAWGYGVYMVAVLAVVWLTFRAVSLRSAVNPAAASTQLTASAPQGEAMSPPSWRTQLYWIALSACPSLLLVATTQHLTLDIAPIPFLWVAPLVLYLLTFVLCFEYPRWVPQPLIGYLAVGAATILSLFVALPFLMMNYIVELLVACGALFAMMLFCHRELYAQRPNPAHLTRFYLMNSLGGALGGIFVGLVAQYLFTGYHEIYVGLVGCPLLVWYSLRLRNREAEGEPMELNIATTTPLCAAALAVALPFTAVSNNVLLAERNFFGALRVVELPADETRPAARQLDHGSTKHGLQFQDEAHRCTATTYFSEDSGAGRMLRMLNRKSAANRVGIVGLGVGTLTAFSRPGDEYVYYEINPLIEQVARNYFTFLNGCAETAKVRLGDARIQLEAESPNQYQALILDAFSGDSIPIHLLTHEAFLLYGKHVATDGLIAVNISNRYLDLRPVVRSSAHSAGFAVTFLMTEGVPSKGSFDALWAVMSRDPQNLQDTLLHQVSVRTPQPERDVVWTDDFSNLFSVLSDHQ